MLEGMFKLLGEYGNPVPRYTGPRCLVERLAVGGCDLCQQACPHEAVSIDRAVSIDPAKCTSCGLCVQACPTGALEYDVSATLGAVKAHGEGGATLTCSQSGAGGQTLPCLGRVNQSAVVASGAWGIELTLLHGDCPTCTVGRADVPERLAAVVESAQQLRAATGRPARVNIRKAAGEQLSGPQVSRRGMFGALARSASRMAAQVIPESPLPFVDWSVPEERRPAEWLWRRRAMKPTPAPETLVIWAAPRILDGCIDCPVCTNVCPTEAIAREVHPDGLITLHLDLTSCTGCSACARSCPPQVIVMSPEVEEGAFAEPQLLREGGQVY
ncbi:4Fe-4S dicluster domain-containing protein [Deinococcus psychrotolerans]|uniref:4Fe-4S dicluster domain-containing protein n=1 Tax=Deinococcus psychrotolerans TaxID=2489213 RepID=A0A3G8YBX6_9DEIO|nr:4Fe-4S binding protein [Deinococcus psychrotolerans]AZI42505.1 4Fe-4S dicluster domain-containing protein [Deinococcus psychrotolerans]